MDSEMGAWIAEWSSHLTLNTGMLGRTPRPWVHVAIHDQLFIWPNYIIYTFWCFYLIYLVWHYILSVKFIIELWNSKLKINEIYFILKIMDSKNSLIVFTVLHGKTGLIM